MKKDDILHIRIEGNLKRRIRKEAKRKEVSVSELVAQTMDRSLRRREAQA